MTFQQITTCGDGGVDGVEDNVNGDGDGGFYDSVDGYFGDDNFEIIASLWLYLHLNFTYSSLTIIDCPA